MEKTPLELFKEKCIEYLSKRPSLGGIRVQIRCQRADEKEERGLNLIYRRRFNGRHYADRT